jgi:hypothetical protein
MRNADGASIFFLSYRVHMKIMEAVWPLTALCVIPPRWLPVLLPRVLQNRIVHPVVEHGLKLAEFMTCRAAGGPEGRLSTSGADPPKRHRSRVVMPCLLAPVWLSGSTKVLL